MKKKRYDNDPYNFVRYKKGVVVTSNNEVLHNATEAKLLFKQNYSKGLLGSSNEAYKAYRRLGGTISQRKLMEQVEKEKLGYNKVVRGKKSVTKTNRSIGFDSLHIGDTINYDLKLSDHDYKNETMLVLDKNATHVKLRGTSGSWISSKRFFNANVKNVRKIRG